MANKANSTKPSSGAGHSSESKGASALQFADEIYCPEIVDELKLIPFTGSNACKHYLLVLIVVFAASLACTKGPQPRALEDRLVSAAESGDILALRDLLKQRVDVNAQPEGRTALAAAAHYGSLDAVKLLLASGANVNAQEGGGAMETAISDAAEYCFSEIVQTLLQHGANPNIRDTDVHTSTLVSAISAPCFGRENDRKSMVEELLAHGADPNVQDEHSRTALEIAADAAGSGEAEIVEMLLAHGANPNCKNTQYGTPLELAAAGGHADVVQILLRKGANPNLVGKEAPLVEAVNSGNAQTVNLLLTAGADPDASALDGTPVSRIAKNRGDIAMQQLLARYGANPAPPTQQELSLKMKMDAIGNIDLDPRSVTWARLCDAFGATPSLDFSTKNTIEVKWFDAIEAEFYAPDGKQSPGRKDLPIRIKIRAPFEGSIRGVHVGDSVSRAVALGTRRGYKANYSDSDIWIEWDPLWSAYIARTAVERDRIVELEVSDNRYMTLFSFADPPK